FRALAFELFRDRAAIDDVIHQTQRSRSTIVDYLADFIVRENVDDISPWIPAAIYQKVASAAREVGSERLKPIFIAFEEKVPYDEIRLVVAHMTRNRSST